MKRIIILTLAVCSLLIAHAQTALADGIIIPEPPICLNCPVPPPSAREVPYLTVETHRVHVTIKDQIATTRVDQLFRNDSEWSLEGTYIFPMPEHAAISDFAMWINGERVEGQLYTKEEARQIYDAIVRQRLDPALLEYVGRDLFQASIFPIDSGDSRRIEIEYSQPLAVDNGLVEYVYPLATEKFSAKPLENVAITVEIESKEALKTIYSASHPVSLAREGAYQALVGWEAANVLPDTDFSLYYTISPDTIGLNLLTYKRPSEDGFFTLFVTPDVNRSETDVVEKDVLLVLDSSGSMEGEKMAQARDALTFVLNHLNEGDRFNVVAFSTGVRTFSQRLESLSALPEARRFVENLEPGGSTDINRALLETMSLTDKSRPTIVIFLTDGLPTSGVVETPIILNNIEQAANDNIRIFPFGVGDDVDTILLDTLAQEVRGASAYVRPGERIDEQISSFYNKVSTPVLADLALEVSGSIILEDSYPHPLPDLFAGTQLILTGRYRNSGPAVITLTGTVNGETRQFVYDDLTFASGRESFFRPSQQAAFVPRLWATRKVGHLLNQIRLHGESREAIDEIVNLSVRYGIITPYTSFLVEEPELALRNEGRSQFVEDTFMAAEEAEAMPASGEAAVDRAVEQQALAGAERAAVPMTTALEQDKTAATTTAPIKIVADKTFVLKDQVWVDTTFDRTTMTTTQLIFASDGFFDLLKSQPDLGQYFAVGPRVIVVLGDIAYEMTEA